MSEVHLAPGSTGTGLTRLFQTTNPDRLGSINVVLDGSASTDRDLTGGDVMVTITDPEYYTIYAGRIDSNPEADPSIHVEDDAMAATSILHALSRIDGSSKS